MKRLLAIFFFCWFSSAFAQVNQDSLYTMQKSPWGAVLRSTVLPGWGQLYNQSYWKIPVIWGFNGWFIYNYFYNHNKYKDYQALYLSVPNGDYKVNRDFYRDQRDQFAIYLGITYVLTLVDAYVDAQLFDFSVEEDPLPGTAVSLSARFHF